MRYLKLAGPALAPVLDKIREAGDVRPNPLLSVGFAAVDEEGNVKAQILVHSVCMAEYTLAEKGYGHCLVPLFKMAHEFVEQSGVERVLMHTDSRPMEKMLARINAKPWPVKLWQLLRSK